MEKKIVVVGAGYAGILTAKKLARRLKKHRDVTVTIIDRHPYHTMLTELHEVAANRVPEDHVRISLKRIFAGRRVEVKLDTVKAVDYESKTIEGENQTYSYDYLVIATGSKPTYFGTPGAEQYSYPLWSFDDALKLKYHIIEAFKKAVSETDPEKRRSLLTFYIVGAGFTGAEMVGELAEWVPALCDEYEVPREAVRIVDVDMLDRVVPVFPPNISTKVERHMKKKGVEVVLKTGVAALGDGYIELKQGDRLYRERTETVIWTAGVEGSSLVSGAEALKKAGRARLQTDDFLRAEGREDVFVAGDNIFYIPEGQKAPVPQMVENAEQSAETVAHNVLVSVTGQGKLEKYRPNFHGAMLSLGGRHAAASIGGNKKKISFASFFAMLVKHLIYVIYFIQILGWNKLFSYVKNEFFTIRRQRSILGGHFSNRSPTFLLVPLRVFYGAYWIYEAVQKINENWLSSPKLAAYFQGAVNVFNSVLQAPGGSDATSSATTTASGVAAPIGKLLMDIDVLGIFRVILISTTDIAIRVQCGLMDWFNNTFLLQTANQQMFFQYVVVLSEFVIGVFLVLGLFTFLSSGYSLILQAMFLMSTGMFLSQWWMVFAGIALLIGAGRTFGLDYYVMPPLKKHWKNVRWVRKSYLYHD